MSLLNKILKFFRLKKYKRQLLDSLETVSENVDPKDPLQKVRKALGSVAYVVGNPLTKTEISLQISVVFVNLAGAIIIAPAALPAACQTFVPVNIFGLTDFYGGFNRMHAVLPIQQAWLAAPATNGGIYGYNYNGGVPAAALVALFNFGDLILRYDDVAGLGFAAFVIIHCNNVAYGTFLNSFVSDLITLDTIRYIVPAANINQFINPVIFGVQSLFGKTVTDSVDPRMYITNKDFQPQISDIPINLPIDKTIMTGFQLDVFCQQVSWVLFVKKVESLTHK